MGEAVNLNAERAHRNGDARLWGPEDALRDLLRAIEDGEVNPDWLVIFYTQRDDPDDHESSRTIDYQIAGTTRTESLALAGAGHRMLMDEWMGND